MMVIFFAFVGVACSPSSPKVATTAKRTVKVVRIIRVHSHPSGSYQSLLQRAGLVDIASVDTSIRTDIKYATPDNMLSRDLYQGVRSCFLHPLAAHKLKQAQFFVKQYDSKLSIVVFDATRPCVVQQQLWDESPLSIEQKRNFLSDPSLYSLHSFGMAVDCGLCTTEGVLLDMGTPFDFPGERAFPVLETLMVAKGQLSGDQVMNRNILRDAMLKAGFLLNKFEWWHFSASSRSAILSRFARIDDFKHFTRPDTTLIVPWAHSSQAMFRVQVAASVVALPRERFLVPGRELVEYNHDGMYKYAIGQFASYMEAFLIKDSLVQQGFAGAFVVCFRGNTRVSLRDVQ